MIWFQLAWQQILLTIFYRYQLEGEKSKDTILHLIFFLLPANFLNHSFVNKNLNLLLCILQNAMNIIKSKYPAELYCLFFQTESILKQFNKH